MKNSQTKEHSRSEVIRDTFVIQLKLIVDGLRDLMLMPLVIGATIAGLLMHTKHPGRYLYRLLSYGKASEKYIGLFDEADKDHLQEVDLKEQKLDDLLRKTQTVLESKFINEEKKQQVINKLDAAFDDINGRINQKGADSKSS
jgi:hypothetical protein